MSSLSALSPFGLGFRVTDLAPQTEILFFIRPALAEWYLVINFSAELARCPPAISLDRADFSAVLTASALTLDHSLSVALVLWVGVVSAPRLTP